MNAEAEKVLSIIAEVNQRYGYVVMSSTVPLPIGFIVPEILLVEGDEPFPQPFKVVGAAERSEWDEQCAFFESSFPPSEYGPYFYRMMTD